MLAQLGLGQRCQQSCRPESDQFGEDDITRVGNTVKNPILWDVKANILARLDSTDGGVELTMAKDVLVKIQADPMEGLALTLVDGEGVGCPEWELLQSDFHNPSTRLKLEADARNRDPLVGLCYFAFFRDLDHDQFPSLGYASNDDFGPVAKASG